jgi:hypothetical protein
MSPLEQLLSDAADFVDSGISADRTIAKDINTLFAAGQKPHLWRELKGVTGSLTITLSPPE